MLSLNPPHVICQTLSSRLRELRLARNVSQQELAGMAGASLSGKRGRNNGNA
ncbi:helix-turn-helix domain-containing protein [Vandammella animalimorsus]|uniref:helix-turn-helix domain-containing protein n=1 Tax=Vandammella animalimorsus TaxID=2029117 RepID=UPI0031B9F41A